MPVQAGQPIPSPEDLMDARPEFRAVLVPKKRTTLAAEIATTVEKIHGPSGAVFAKGDTLAELDCAMPEAQLRKALTVWQGFRDENATIQRLAELKSVGELEARRKANDLEKAQADVAIWRIRIKQCLITAPFSGRINKIRSHQYQFVSEGEPLMDILDHRNLEMTIIVPSSWVGWLQPGSKFAISISETDKTYPGAVTSIGAEVNSLNQTIRAVGKIVGNHPELLPGMSGSVHFERFEQIPASGFKP